MTTLLNTPRTEPKTEHRVLFRGVDWNFYDTVLRSLENRRVFVTYDRGNLEIMSPLPEHESWSSWINIFIRALSQELGIEIRTLGSTTWRRRELNKGLEPDKCFYIQNVTLVWNRDDIDLTRDPPPDLAVEVDITSGSLDRMGIYAALGVPEIWRFDGDSLHVHLLQADRTYRESQRSRAFPKLPIAEFERFLHLRFTVMENELERQFREWVRTTLAGH